jgi:hypothetical protein
MDADLFLVVGIVLVILAVPAVISAFSSAKPPRAAAISFVLGGALIVAAITIRPGGYRLDEVPDVVARVIDRYLR